MTFLGRTSGSGHSVVFHKQRKYKAGVHFRTQLYRAETSCQRWSVENHALGQRRVTL